MDLELQFVFSREADDSGVLTRPRSHTLHLCRPLPHGEAVDAHTRRTAWLAGCLCGTVVDIHITQDENVFVRVPGLELQAT